MRGACTPRWLRCKAAGGRARSSIGLSPGWANPDASRPLPSGTPAGTAAVSGSGAAGAYCQRTNNAGQSNVAQG